MKRRISPAERLSVGFVRLSAFATIAALFLILGYIFWKGFFYSNVRDYAVTSRAEASLGGALLVVSPGVRVSELPFDEVRNLFADEYSTWKQLDGQDIDLYPLVSDEISPLLPDVLALPEPGFLVSFPGSTEDTVRMAAGQSGAAALVDERAFSALDPALRSRVRAVRVRPWALAANAEVTALRDNRRIGTIAESALARLYRGEIANWAELDGADLPVTVVIPPEGDPLFAVVTGAGFSAAAPARHRALTASLNPDAASLPRGATDAARVGDSAASPRFLAAATTDEYYALLASIPGAAGIVAANRAESAGLSVIRLSRTETGRNLNLDFLLQAPKDSGKIGGISTIIANTFLMIMLTLVLAVPPGLFAAVYLVEYAREGRLVRIIRLGTETLAGIPSIIFGLFGMLVFVQGFGWGISLLSGSLTVTLMILPTIVRTAEEALKSVPRALQEGSLALGATKVQTIFRVVLPAAFPAIAGGVILAVGRALGETAALIYTMGSNYNLTSGLFDSTRTLSVHIYLIIAEGISSDRAFASAAVLVLLILAVNTAARVLVNRVGRMTRA